MPVLKVYKDGVWEELGGTSPMDGGNADTLDGKHASEFASVADVNRKLDITGGTMEGTLTVNGIVLTPGVDYGTDMPSGGVIGQLYFKKVT